MQTGREERRGGGLGQLCVGTGGGKAGSLEAGSAPSPPPSSQRPASRPGSQDGLTQHPLKEGTSKLLKITKLFSGSTETTPLSYLI